jgi:hypothetical protein
VTQTCLIAVENRGNDKQSYARVCDGGPEIVVEAIAMVVMMYQGRSREEKNVVVWLAGE